MTYRKPFTLAILCALCLVAAIILAGSLAQDASAHVSAPAKAVALTDASDAPTFLRMIPPRGHVTPARAIHDRLGRPCRNPETGKRGYFSNVQAYAWNGASIGGQQYDHHESIDFWRIPGLKRVVWYDGLTFHNPTRTSVLVAGWCES